MKNENLNVKLENFRSRKNKLNDDMRTELIDILKSQPSKSLNLTDSPAYSYVEGYENWEERQIYGIRLKEDNFGESFIELTLQKMADENDEDEPDWSDEDYIASESSHHIDINWLSLMGAAVYAV